MSCGGDSFFANQYYNNLGYKSWNTAVLHWVSTTQDSPKPFSNTFVNPDSYSGYFEANSNNQVEVEKLGDSALLSSDIYKYPYGDILRPLANYTKFFREAKHIVVQQIGFEAFDVTKTGSLYQNADVNAAIATTLSQTSESYIKTRLYGAMPVNWLNNFFRPKVIINNQDILRYTNSSAMFDDIQVKSNKSDLSIGLCLPLTLDVNIPIEAGNSSNALDLIRIQAICGQVVNVSNAYWIKRYPLRATIFMTFI